MRLLPEFEHLAETPDHKLMIPEVAKATGIPYSTALSYVTKTLIRLPAEKVQHPRGDYYLVTVRDLLSFEPPSMGRPWPSTSKVKSAGERVKAEGKKAKTRKKAAKSSKPKKRPLTNSQG